MYVAKEGEWSYSSLSSICYICHGQWQWSCHHFRRRLAKFSIFGGGRDSTNSYCRRRTSSLKNLFIKKLNPINTTYHNITMAENMSISDLLPLVAVALNDQAAADAARELAIAREERDRSHRVEVLRAIDNGDGEDEDDETVVYASALFEDGRYHGNPNLWDVTLEENSSNICRLADLRDCHICVGGGFPGYSR